MSDDVLRFIIALIVALAAPLFGLLFAGFLAWRAHNDGRSGVRNQMLAIAVLAAVLMVAPVGIWGHVISGL